jgi:hypothetical protein
MGLSRCLLAEDYDGTRYEIETPLTSFVDYREVRMELGIPEYVDSESFLMERGLVTLWGALRIGSFRDFAAKAESVKIPFESTPTVFFGGGAIKLLCPVANNPHSPLYRDINDIDLVTSKKQSQTFYRLLLALGDICGTRYYHFVTQTDRRFNAMRGGERLRVRAIDEILSENSLKPGILDIFTDKIELRHELDVRDALRAPDRNMYTIGVENMLLAKCLYIFDIDLDLREELTAQQLDYRVLDYPYFRSNRLLIGMEEKDIKDICAILLSHGVNERQGSLDVANIKLILERDKKLAQTFRLNLENLLRNEAFLEHLVVSHHDLETIISRIGAILSAVPALKTGWKKPWWNEDVETPEIFGRNRSIE